METGLQHAHSYLAYLVVFILIIASINAITGTLSKRQFTDKDRKLNLFALIFTHTQFLIGIILYFVSPMVQPIGNAMKDANMRLYALEHPLINLLAVILITAGYSIHKRKANSYEKFKIVAICFTIGTLLILSRIPYFAWF